MKERAWSLLGAGVTIPWCCVLAAVLSVIGVTGLTLGGLIQVDAALFPSLALAAIGLLELLIPNMVCEGCATKIRTALSLLPGVREVKSKVPQKHVYVRYEPSKV